MKIIVALDSFKGTLTAVQACDIVADAIRKSMPSSEVITVPMADGGEGTAAAMIAGRSGRWISKTVTGPLPGREVQAGFAWFEAQKQALVEMAAASGITLIGSDELNPMKTTTWGTGQLIQAAANYGAQRILLAVGGSATVDGGVGAAMALGWQFLDADGQALGPGGAVLEHIRTIVRPDDLTLPPIEVLSDVDNPLCGPRGAARVFGPQKGATPAMVEQLEHDLNHLASLIATQVGKDVTQLPGAGAAGGLGGGAAAFMDATIALGIDRIIEVSHIMDHLADADWVITGEGAFDHQSLMGKVISGICRAAKESSTSVAVIAGQVSVQPDEYKRHGIVTAVPCRKPDMPLAYALEHADSLLAQAAGSLQLDKP